MRALLAALLLVAGPGPVFTVSDPRIDEASGMVDLGRTGTVVVNDSGDQGRVFLLDDTGATVGVTTYGTSVDAEALAPGGGASVWVGDIGDNGAQRDHVEVRRVPVGRGDRSVDVASYRLVYPDGPHDAETLMRQPGTGRLFVITKAVGGGTVYAAPETLSPTGDNRLTPVGEVSVWATDGAFLDPGHVIVRSYATASVYTFPALARVGRITLPDQPQGESVSVGPGGRVRIGSEGADQPVIEVDVPAAARGQSVPSPSATRSPAEAGDTAPRSSDDDQVSQGSGSVAVTVGVAALVALGVAAAGVLVVRRRR